MSATAIHNCLSKLRLPLTNEKELQRAIHDELVLAGFAARREVRLSQADIIDHMVDGVGIECKIKGQRRAIFRQLERYAEHAAIEELILVTNVPMGVPPEIKGKPVYVVNLAMGWL